MPFCGWSTNSRAGCPTFPPSYNKASGQQRGDCVSAAPFAAVCLRLRRRIPVSGILQASQAARPFQSGIKHPVFHHPTGGTFHCGLRPILAFFSFTVSLPMAGKMTSRPSARHSRARWARLSTKSAVSFLDCPVRSDSASINSCLVRMIIPSLR